MKGQRLKVKGQRKEPGWCSLWWGGILSHLDSTWSFSLAWKNNRTTKTHQQRQRSNIHVYEDQSHYPACPWVTTHAVAAASGRSPSSPPGLGPDRWPSGPKDPGAVKVGPTSATCCRSWAEEVPGLGGGAGEEEEEEEAELSGGGSAEAGLADGEEVGCSWEAGRGGDVFNTAFKRVTSDPSDPTGSPWTPCRTCAAPPAGSSAAPWELQTESSELEAAANGRAPLTEFPGYLCRASPQTDLRSAPSPPCSGSRSLGGNVTG